MSRYLILAETGSDVPLELKEKYNIQIVPMHVGFGTTTRDDGSFDTEEVFSFYKKTGILPKTSGCNVADFDRTFDEIHRKYPDRHILYLAYSAVTTCSYQSALLSAKRRDYVTSIDTKQVSAGQCMVIVLTARYLERNPDVELDQVVKQIERYCKMCHMGFFPGDLDYLRAGGRVSNVAYLGAKILSLNPLIEVVDGKLLATKKYRGKMERVAIKLLNDFTEKHKLSRQMLYFPHSPGLHNETKQMIETRAKEMGFQEIRWIQTGSVVSTHSGPGAFGVCGISDSADQTI